MPADTRKRKADTFIDLDDEEDEELAESRQQAALAGITPGAAPKKRTKKNEEPAEKRLCQFRKKAPQSYNERLERVRAQRMFLIDRERKTTTSGTLQHEVEVFDIAGSTGNVYQVTISRQPSCTCPDNSGKGNQCKHIIYVLVNVLKAPAHLAYQLAFLTTELAQIFSSAPTTPQSNSPSSPSSHSHSSGNRKPIEGDCPVCVMEFETGEDIIWCRAACGNNIHRQCFEQWTRAQAGGQQVKCVYCRTPWQNDPADRGMLKGLTRTAERTEEGYVNVAGELGISGVRDTSSYHQPWVRQQRRRGWY